MLQRHFIDFTFQLTDMFVIPKARIWDTIMTPNSNLGRDDIYIFLGFSCFFNSIPQHFK